MAFNIVESYVDIPDGVDVSIDGKRVRVSGPRGAIEKDFTHAKVEITLDGDRVRVWAVNPRKREKALVKTIASHINNMIRGVTKGFRYKLKIVYVHFPINIQVVGDRVLIQNFLGERKPREARIIGDTKVYVQGEDVIVEGIDIEAVGQTAANIQQATRIRRKDLRKFLDGIYVYAKEEIG
ncbi:50S ribosomal protein L6 [Candidatus Bathyarchaeota archaeon]|nr:MAG: 50S ribosomal protein L6 [Candidatus Bathyarchaeota archaeon]RLI18861.1 MAG: 50S ribosomal protein L6 [Candidatus Bathyarchaeota archaeon]